MQRRALQLLQYFTAQCSGVQRTSARGRVHACGMVPVTSSFRGSCSPGTRELRRPLSPRQLVGFCHGEHLAPRTGGAKINGRRYVAHSRLADQKLVRDLQECSETSRSVHLTFSGADGVYAHQSHVKWSPRIFCDNSVYVHVLKGVFGSELANSSRETGR